MKYVTAFFQSRERASDVLVGFLGGAALAALIVIVFFLSQSISKINYEYAITATYLAAPPTLTPTPPPLPTPVTYFYETLDEAKEVLNSDPYGAISLLQSIPEEIEDPLFLAQTHAVLSEAYLRLNDLEKFRNHYHIVIELLAPQLDKLTVPQDLALAYRLISHAEYYTDEQALSEEDRQEIERDIIEMIGDSALPSEVGQVYTDLIEAVKFGDPEIRQRYQEQMIERMAFLANEVEDLEELAIAYEYLANAELNSANYQFAAAHFRHLYALRPTAEHAYLTASSYFLGGNHACAYHWFLETISYDQPENSQYVNESQGPLNSLIELFGEKPPECSTSPGN